MVRKLFRGKRKFISIPVLAALSLYFFPILLAILLLLLVKKHIRYSIFKYPVMGLITLFTLPVGAGWFVGMTSPALGNEVSVVTNPTMTPMLLQKAKTTIIPTKKTTVTVTPTKKPTPTVYTPATKNPTKSVQPTVKVVQPMQKTSIFTCNCNKTCSQLSSCSEAQYQLNTCGCSARDADKDGIACDGVPLKCGK